MLEKIHKHDHREPISRQQLVGFEAAQIHASSDNSCEYTTTSFPTKRKEPSHQPSQPPYTTSFQPANPQTSWCRTFPFEPRNNTDRTQKFTASIVALVFAATASNATPIATAIVETNDFHAALNEQPTPKVMGSLMLPPPLRWESSLPRFWKAWSRALQMSNDKRTVAGNVSFTSVVYV